MCEELGGKITEEQCKQAMTELDTNSNGTCSFEEFLQFWAATPNLGGYNSMTLKFLKMKMGLETMLGKGKANIQKATSMKQKPPEEADTTVSFSGAVVPGMMAM